MISVPETVAPRAPETVIIVDFVVENTVSMNVSPGEFLSVSVSQSPYDVIA